ncbi:MAG: chorismate mutase, partial [Clostridia bacterium]|nr:chorismate mutase [Clostridia bacterium]
MDELDRLRGQIDLIDKEMISLFEKRMELVLGVAEYKKTHNTGVLQTSREDEVLQKAVDNLTNKDYADSARQLMVELMGLSKDLQRKKISKSNLFG